MDSATQARLESLLEELEALLKAQVMGASLGQRDVNGSPVLVAVQAVAAYLAGARRRAAEGFAIVAEEVGSRLELGR